MGGRNERMADMGENLQRLLWISPHLSKARAKSHILASNTRADIG